MHIFFFKNLFPDDENHFEGESETSQMNKKITGGPRYSRTLYLQIRFLSLVKNDNFLVQNGLFINSGFTVQNDGTYLHSRYYLLQITMETCSHNLSLSHTHTYLSKLMSNDIVYFKVDDCRTKVKYIHDRYTTPETMNQLPEVCPNLQAIFLDTPEKGILKLLPKFSRLTRLKGKSLANVFVALKRIW